MLRGLVPSRMTVLSAAQRGEIDNAHERLVELAEREFKKLRKAIRRVGPSPNHAVLHAIRIKTKRARYAAELALWSAAVRALAVRLPSVYGYVNNHFSGHSPQTVRDLARL